MDPYASIHGSAEALRSGQTTSVALVEAALERVERLDASRLRSFLTVCAEEALADAAARDRELAAGEDRGPLHGVPVGIKDLIDVRGLPTTCGSRARADFIASEDAPVVARLREAGAVILGKLHTTEFAYVGYHPDFPRPLNPWSPAHWPGLSSSGSAIAVAAGLCALSLGTDTGGSIRFPAASCGVVGLKPTRESVSTEGVFPLCASLDHVGGFTRRVGDAATLFEVLSGGSSSLPDVSTLRLGVDPEYNERGVDEELAGRLRDAAGVFAGAGATVVEVRLPELDAALDAFNLLFCVECADSHRELFAQRAEDYGPALREHLPMMLAVDPASRGHADAIRQRLNAAFDELFERIDVLLCPSTIGPPPKLVNPENEIRLNSPSAPYTIPYDLTGQPTLSVPCGLSHEGLPLSLQLVGRHGEEQALFACGLAWEAATDHWTLHPPL